MDDETPAELLQQLLDACNQGTKGAIHLAERTEIEALRAFLHESAQQYRRAADDLRTVWKNGSSGGGSTDRRRDTEIGLVADGDVVAFWERAECEALTYFRDAYDTPLPAPVADTVKRHFEAGVKRLERLRKLQTGSG